MWAYQARYRVPLNKAVAGNWVLLEGVDATSERAGPPPAAARAAWGGSARGASATSTLLPPLLAPLALPLPAAHFFLLFTSLQFFSPHFPPSPVTKTATIVPEFMDEEVYIMKPLAFNTQVGGSRMRLVGQLWVRLGLAASACQQAAPATGARGADLAPLPPSTAAVCRQDCHRAPQPLGAAQDGAGSAGLAGPAPAPGCLAACRLHARRSGAGSRPRVLPTPTPNRQPTGAASAHLPPLKTLSPPPPS